MTPPTHCEIFESSTSTYWIHDNILYMVSRKGRVQTLEQTIKFTKELKTRLEGKKYCAVIDVSNASTSDKESRNYSQEILPELFTAMAFVVSSPLSRMVATIQLKVAVMSLPAKIFGDENSAVKWLKQYN